MGNFPGRKRPYRGNPKRDVHDARREARARDKADACAALDRMGAAPSRANVDPDGWARRVGLKVLRPPPGPLPDAPRRTAAALALAADKRAGLVGRPEFSLDTYEEQGE